MKLENCSEELAKAELEIEELGLQLADMLGVALHFAGVKEQNIPQAIDAYLEGLDEVYGDEDGEMGFKEIVKVISHLKNTKKNLFS